MFILHLHSLISPLRCLLLIFALLTWSSSSKTFQLSHLFSLTTCILLTTIFFTLAICIHVFMHMRVELAASICIASSHVLDAAQIQCSDNKTDHIAYCMVTLVNCSETAQWPTATLYSASNYSKYSLFLDNMLNSETIFFTVAPQLYQDYTYNHSVANAALECTNVALESSYEAPEDCSRNFVYS